MKQDEAEIIAYEALEFLASDAARFERFLSMTGLTVAGLKTAARETAAQAAILDFVFRDDALLRGLDLSSGRKPADVFRAIRMLDPAYEGEPPVTIAVPRRKPGDA